MLLLSSHVFSDSCRALGVRLCCGGWQAELASRQIVLALHLQEDHPSSILRVTLTAKPVVVACVCRLSCPTTSWQASGSRMSTSGRHMEQLCWASTAKVSTQRLVGSTSHHTWTSELYMPASGSELMDVFLDAAHSQRCCRVILPLQVTPCLETLLRCLSSRVMC